jgi:hypothetical protein
MILDVLVRTRKLTMRLLMFVVQLHLLQHPLRETLVDPFPVFEAPPTKHVIAGSKHGLVWVVPQSLAPLRIVLKLQPFEVRQASWTLTAVVFMLGGTRRRLRKAARAKSVFAFPEDALGVAMDKRTGEQRRVAAPPGHGEGWLTRGMGEQK